MGYYVSNKAVMDRLAGKVRFTTNPEEDGEENKMPISLLNEIVMDSESQVEMDLSARYMAPFQTSDGKPFSLLSERPTKQWIRTLVLLQCTIRVLETDFGRGGPTDAENYSISLFRRYRGMIKDHMELKANSYNTYVKPPLPDLMLNYQNEEADTGFKGRVLTLNTEYGDGDYAADQVNSPSQTFWRVTDEDLLSE